MARKKRRRAKASEPAGGKVLAAYEHAEQERANNPPVGLVTPETDPESPPGEYSLYRPSGGNGSRAVTYADETLEAAIETNMEFR